MSDFNEDARTGEIDADIVEQSLANIDYKEVVPAPMKITIEVTYEVAKKINDSARKNNTAFEVEASILLKRGIDNLEKTRQLMEAPGRDSLLEPTQFHYVKRSGEDRRR